MRLNWDHWILIGWKNPANAQHYLDKGSITLYLWLREFLFGSALHKLEGAMALPPPHSLPFDDFPREARSAQPGLGLTPPTQKRGSKPSRPCWGPPRATNRLFPLGCPSRTLGWTVSSTHVGALLLGARKIRFAAVGPVDAQAIIFTAESEGEGFDHASGGLAGLIRSIFRA